MRGGGRHGGVGRFPGRAERRSGVFDQFWSGSYARAGYLKTFVRRRALHSKIGRGPAREDGLPIARVRGPVDGDVSAFVLFVSAPAAVRTGGDM